MALTAEVNALMARNVALEVECRELRKLYHELAPIVRKVHAEQEWARNAASKLEWPSASRRRGKKKRPVTRRG